MQNSCNAVYPTNMVSFRYIIEHTLHKGDNKDNNNNNNNNNNSSNNTCDWKLLNIITEHIPIKLKTGNARSLRILQTIATDSVYLIEGVESLNFTGSWTRHPVIQRVDDCHYDDDDVEELPITHSGRVFKA
jgi:hypothetical protein